MLHRCGGPCLAVRLLLGGRPVSDLIMIEPDGPQRPAFAAWGLAQDPPLQTATASGWNVPVELYPSVPPELLEGAYVDGYLYDGPAAPETGTEAPAVSSETGTEAPAVPPDTARKPRRARKAVSE